MSGHVRRVPAVALRGFDELVPLRPRFFYLARRSFRPDRYRKKSKQSCEGYVAKKSKYCKEKVTDVDGVSAIDACPATCLLCVPEETACADSTSWWSRFRRRGRRRAGRDPRAD